MQGPRRVGLEGCSAARDARKDRARGPARPGHEREPRRLAGGRRAPVDGDVDEVVHAPLLRAHVEVDLGAWPVTRRCRPTTGYACCQGLRDAALGGETSARHVRPRSGSTCGAARRCRRSSRALGSRGAVAGARERAASRSQAPMSAPSPQLLPSIQRSGVLQVRSPDSRVGRGASQGKHRHLRRASIFATVGSQSDAHKQTARASSQGLVARPAVSIASARRAAASARAAAAAAAVARRRRRPRRRRGPWRATPGSSSRPSSASSAAGRSSVRASRARRTRRSGPRAAARASGPRATSGNGRSKRWPRPAARARAAGLGHLFDLPFPDVARGPEARAAARGPLRLVLRAREARTEERPAADEADEGRDEEPGVARHGPRRRRGRRRRRATAAAAAAARADAAARRAEAMETAGRATRPCDDARAVCLWASD